ncbi:MAG: hypothetical protein ACRD6W_13795, partial [Nitrososphaerales archaeon]
MGHFEEQVMRHPQLEGSPYKNLIESMYGKGRPNPEILQVYSKGLSGALVIRASMANWHRLSEGVYVIKFDSVTRALDELGKTEGLGKKARNPNQKRFVLDHFATAHPYP